MADKKKGYHHGNLKEVLVANAIQMLDNIGIYEISLRNLAEQTGVSHNAPYKHFKDKNALLCAIATAGFGELNNQLKDSEPEIDFAATIQETARRYYAFARAKPEQFKLMFGGFIPDGDEDDHLREAKNKMWSFFFELADHGRQHGWIESNSTPGVARAIWGLVHGMTALGLDIPGFRSASQNDESMLLLLEGISANPWI